MTMEEIEDNAVDRNRKYLKLSAVGSKELKALYEEYVMRCQQTYHTIPTFHEFIVQMAKNGFHVWQSKNCRTVSQ